jgi:hypothetical protein
MTKESDGPFDRPVRARGPWGTWWRAWYRLIRLVEAPLVWLARGPGFGNLIVLTVAGRRSGRTYRVPLGLLRVEGRPYVGHPSGDAAWTLNVRAAGGAVIESARISATPMRATVLGPGHERDEVVRATFRQHPFPGGLFYRISGRHVFSTGVFFRLEPDDAESP